MGLQARLYPVGGGAGHRSGKCVAFPLPLLQERWRCVLDPLLCDTVPGRHPYVLHGTCPRTDVDDRWAGRVQDCADFQRYWLRGSRHVLLDERVLHCHPGVGHLLLLHVTQSGRSVAYLRQPVELGQLREPLRP
uniref:(northern house mosquito) hypothetical protein n=1 Tax=Culex pipiens TaxID=7175 RepID=A0A8D8MLA6_CULPI